LWELEEVQILGSQTSDERVESLFNFYRDLVEGKDIVDRQLCFSEFKDKLLSLYTCLSDHNQLSIHEIEQEKDNWQRDYHMHRLRIKTEA
jgi:hypothetical protein